MLLALIFRGVAFEFRFKAARCRSVLGWCLRRRIDAGGLCAGHRARRFVQGVPVDGASSPAGLSTGSRPFALMTGVALVIGYALLGAAWLVMKTEGDLQEWAFRLIAPLLVAMLVAIGIVSVWTPLLGSEIAQRWFTWPNLLYLSPVPLLVLALAALLLRAAATRSERTPFLCVIGLFLLSYVGLAISLYPYIVPRAVTFREAAGPGHQPRLHAGRRLRPAAHHPHLHRLQLLGVPRQDGRGLPSLSRVAWFAGLWLAGVLTLAIVAYALRWLLGL